MEAAETPIPLIPINVWLGGRSYRIRIPVEQEAAVRRSVKEADDKIVELRQHYAGKDDQDFIAMCLLMYATAEASSPTSGINNEEVDALVQKIDKALSKE
jgi:cell division protein ZapA